MGRCAVREHVLWVLACLLWAGCVGSQAAGSAGGMWAMDGPHEEARRAEVESALDSFWSLRVPERKRACGGADAEARGGWVGGGFRGRRTS